MTEPRRETVEARRARAATAAFVLLCACYAALIGWAVVELPARVPTHWSGGSGPDSWSSRTAAVLTLSLLGAGLAGLFAALMLFLPRSRRLTGLNVPNRDFWLQDQHLPRARAMARTDLAVLGGLTMALSCLIPPSLVSAARDPEHRLPGWFLPALLVLLAAILGYAVLMGMLRWRLPRDGQTASG